MIATNLSQNVPVGHFVNFSEHKTCIRKLHAIVNIYIYIQYILRWKKEPGSAVAFCELALLFHHLGHRVKGDFSAITIQVVICMLRQAFQYLIKNQDIQTCPGDFSSTFVKSNGRVLPQSAVVGAVPWVQDSALLFIAQTVCNGAGRTIESWRSPFLSA